MRSRGSAIDSTGFRCRSSWPRPVVATSRVEQIARELDDRFRLLTGGARTVVERQQTLKASIDWSHDLLDAAERAALRRLGVFSGPFTVGAAEAVVAAFGDIDRYDVLDLVDHLADKSLVALDGVDPAGNRGIDCWRRSATTPSTGSTTPASWSPLAMPTPSSGRVGPTWHNVHFDCSLTILDAIPPNLANLTAAARWACVNRPELLQALMLCIGPFVQLEDG